MQDCDLWQQSAACHSCLRMCCAVVCNIGLYLPLAPTLCCRLPPWCASAAGAHAELQSARPCLLQAPMLYCGEHIGNGTLEPKVDIAVDPLDGTTSIAMVSPLRHVARSVRVEPTLSATLRANLVKLELSFSC